ncbi:site-specific DNA-methyltransferase [Rhodococcus sp. DN22]|uniref:site-specific DNA-methyltransferase n=1 Tax=Rhodococcus sp. DN22 TaxID=357684 RepID=UPI0030CCF1A8
MNARKAPTPKGPTPVERIKHEDKRTNLPTADAHEFVTPEIEAPRTVLYPRDTSLDPQLVWKGKDSQDSQNLEVDAPPIFIQEKIDPRVLIENLRKTSKTSELEPELTMFDVFDGLDEYDAVDFYRHSANWSNRMILGDSLQVMSSLSEREDLRSKVQMVYIDPPYGIKFGSNFQTSSRSKTVRDGKIEDITRDSEQIRAFRDTWELGIHSYLAYLRDRLVAAYDLLNDSGSVFVQIGDDNSHLVRLLLDEIFGSGNYVSCITVKKASSATSQSLPNISDYILWYAKDATKLKYRTLYTRRSSTVVGDPANYRYLMHPNGEVSTATTGQLAGIEPLPEGAKVFFNNVIISSTASESTLFEFEFKGKKYRPPGRNGWKTNLEGMKKLARANRIYSSANGKTLQYIRYWNDFSATALTNIWTDTMAPNLRDGNNYIVKTNPKIIERCMLMSTDPGDLVIDPTCGGGTTAYVAEKWGRRWITIDTSRVSLALARERLISTKYPYFLLADSKEGQQKELEISGRTNYEQKVTGDIRHGFVYDRVPRVKLSSITRNPDVVDGMSQSEIDECIARNAEQEMLYGSPFEGARKIRVAGPFTVESLSPHRAASFKDPKQEPIEKQQETLSKHYELGEDVSKDESFEQMILANLAAAGIQNGRKSERMSLQTPEAYPGQFVQAVAAQSVEEGEAPLRVGLAIGPQYGTVSPRFVKDAAREAITAGDIDILAVLAFAFDPAASGVKTADGGGDLEKTDDFAAVAASRNLGRLPVLFVRMNADLLMGDELKKTGSGNMFMVFGEPDIELHVNGDDVVVDLLGVDVYDPNTGKVRTNDTSQIALWMIDSDYNSESFFVRHCYFTGGNKPYEQLQRALKADIDVDAWETLYSTTSHPFPKPSTGRIAVKVINDYGDEVMKIFEVE